MTFQEKLLQRTKSINDILYACLPEETGNAKSLYEACNYSILAGGKRIRPMLVLETYQLFLPNSSDEQRVVLHAFLSAIEFIHTYSLVHDDLPAMDNDMLRRGKPTTHAAYGEAMGILAGDALLTYAFEIISSAIASIDLFDNKNYQPSSEKFMQAAVRAMALFSNKSGMYGMIKGQVIDMEYTETYSSTGSDNKYEDSSKKKIDLPVLLEMYENKTSALLEASMLSGAILGGATKDELSVVDRLSRKLGLAFQICDDILDVEGSEEKIGKPVHSDDKNKKNTYVVLAGIENAKKMAEALTNECLELLDQLPGEKSFLKELFMFLLKREY